MFINLVVFAFRRERFGHVEILDEEGISYGIVRGETVHAERRSQAVNYMHIDISVPANKYDSFFGYLRKQQQEKKGFNLCGMIWNHCFCLNCCGCCYVRAAGRSFFCTELAASAMVYAGILDLDKDLHGEVCNIGVTQFYELLGKKFDPVPAKNPNHHLAMEKMKIGTRPHADDRGTTTTYSHVPYHLLNAQATQGYGRLSRGDEEYNQDGLV